MEKRLTPARQDLAADFLKGKVEAERFVSATQCEVGIAVAPLRRAPEESAPLETELLYGERFDVYEDKDGWSWGQFIGDGYVGYIQNTHLRSQTAPPTHRVSHLRTYLYTEADLKSPPRALLSMGSKLAVSGQEGRFCVTQDGFVFADHLCQLNQKVEDWVSVAQTFLGTPYFWGGRSSLGLDCSSLVQLALEQTGIEVPRDSDLQCDVGREISRDALRRGDLVFWKGHVGIMVDESRFVHANATHMAVTIDDLDDFAQRIEEAEGPITALRRPG